MRECIRVGDRQAWLVCWSIVARDARWRNARWFMRVRGHACVRCGGGGVRYMMWYSLCECVRSKPITTPSTATLFSTLFHSIHINSSHCGGPSLLHSYVRRSVPTLSASRCGHESPLETSRGAVADTVSICICVTLAWLHASANGPTTSSSRKQAQHLSAI